MPSTFQNFDKRYWDVDGCSSTVTGPEFVDVWLAGLERVEAGAGIWQTSAGSRGMGSRVMVDKWDKAESWQGQAEGNSKPSVVLRWTECDETFS